MSDRPCTKDSGVRGRISQHQSSATKKNPPGQLLYFFWTGRAHTRDVDWIRLGRLADEPDETDEDTQTWLNLCEMFYALAFQTLTEHDLARWLGPDSISHPHRGLNVRLPLYQALPMPPGWTFGLNNLLKSTDPAVVNWASQRISEITKKGQEAQWTSQNVPQENWTQAKHWKGLSHSIFNSRGRTDLIREWKQGDPENILIRCSNCKDPRSIRIDSHPKFEIRTGRYVMMRQHCIVCPSKNINYKQGSHYHGPAVPLSCGFISRNSVK